MEVPERVPAVSWAMGVWIVFNSGNDWLSLCESPEKFAKTWWKTAEKFDSDAVWPGSGMNWFVPRSLGMTVKFPPNDPPAVKAPWLIKNEDDLKAVEEKLDKGALQEDEIISTIWKGTKIMHDMIGDKITIGVTAFGPFTYAGGMMGVENLMAKSVENPEWAKRVIDFACKMQMAYYTPLLEEGAIHVVSIADPMTSPWLISRKHYEQFALPALQKVIPYYKSKGASVWLHICGNHEPDKRWELYPQSGATHFLCDWKFNLAYAKSTLGKKMCISGNIDPVEHFDQNQRDPLEVAKECIQAGAPGGGYIITAGCDLPPQIPLEKIRGVNQLAKKCKYKDDGTVVMPS